MPPSMPKRPAKRSLSDEERQLWAKIKRTVVPLDSAANAEPAAPVCDAPEPVMNVKNTPTTAGRAPVGSAPAATIRKPPVPRPFDNKTRMRLSRGADSVGATIDLHGMRQDEAHRALRAFLILSQKRGDRFVIVVTGKGSRNFERDQSDYSQRGILRTAVPQWFTTDSFRELVVGYSEASQSHGGGGALYVQIRRRRLPGKDGGLNGRRK